MTYSVFLSFRAQTDIVHTVRWLEDNLSPSQAAKWYEGLKKALASLTKTPTRYPLAPEAETFGFEIREKLYGKRRSVHRILFAIEEDEVNVIAVRHAARDQSAP